MSRLSFGFNTYIHKSRSEGKTIRRRKRLLNGPKNKKGFGKLTEEALYRTYGTTSFGRGAEPFVRQVTE